MSTHDKVFSVIVIVAIIAIFVFIGYNVHRIRNKVIPTGETVEYFDGDFSIKYQTRFKELKDGRVGMTYCYLLKDKATNEQYLLFVNDTGMACVNRFSYHQRQTVP